MRRPIVLNQSHLKSYLNCHRLYAWIRLQRLEPPLRRSAPEIGTAVHEGLRLLHTEGQTLDSALEATQKKLEERSGPKIAFEDKTLPEAQDIASAVLRSYSEYWGEREDMWAPIDQEVQFLVEVQPGWWHRTFSGDVTDEEGKRLEAEWIQAPSGVWLRGRADNLSVFANALWLIDYKTAAKMDPRDLLKYELDLQLTAYIYGISKQLTMDALKEKSDPVAVQGAIIDLLVKTQVPQFAREKYTRSIDEMTEFEYEFVEYGNEIRSRMERVEAGEDWKIAFPKNTEQCFRYGTCAFRDLCLKDTPVRRSIYNKRERDYVDDAQDALDKETKK